MSKDHYEVSKLPRQIAAATIAALGLISLAKVPHAILDAGNKKGNSDIPALDSDYVVRAGDSPDYIASVAGIEGSDARYKFDQEILREAKAAGSDQLIVGMGIKVPEEFIKNLDKIDQQNN